MNRLNQAPSRLQPTPFAPSCVRCRRKTAPGRAFAFKTSNAAPASPGDSTSSETTKCMRCALMHRPMVKRSLVAALVVGTVLTALNQGDALLSGQWNNALYWKIPLTYCVPFVVATYGALANSRK
ncbi:MAG TPA: nitrate/nitrite transporter NrtS [Dehalococcoidia bacterium]|nr:nitrate/nitrite transporter NrtS [Dehalococcoidia bacterium]